MTAGRTECTCPACEADRLAQYLCGRLNAGAGWLELNDALDRVRIQWADGEAPADAPPARRMH